MQIKNVYDHTPKDGKIEQIVIMLHGVGANGQDLLSFAPFWTQFVPNAVFVSPDAPLPCDVVPPDYPNSYQWFSLKSFNIQEMVTGVKMVFPFIEAFIDEQLKKYTVAPEKLVLMGFSQGTMASLYVAPRLQYKIGGVLGYSGALLGDVKGPDILNKPPIHLIHGERDEIVPIEAWSHARGLLTGAGFAFSGETTPMLGHSIDMNGIQSGGAFLKKCFKLA